MELRRSVWPAGGAVEMVEDNLEMRTYGRYLVGVFDVLGQSKKLQAIHSAASEQHRIDNLRSTVGAVIRTRQRFQEIFIGAPKYGGRASALPEPQRSEMLAAMSGEIVCWGVSDAIYVGVPLVDTRHRAACAGDVFATLLAAAAVWLTGLRENEPIRGGMEIGLGVDIEPGEIYGQALEAAYRLESQVAGRPRIVVGPGCVEYLNTLKQWNSAAEMAGRSLSVLRRDHDDNMIVDGLGPTVRSTFASMREFGEHFAEAHENVRANCRRFREAGD